MLVEFARVRNIKKGEESEEQKIEFLTNSLPQRTHTHAWAAECSQADDLIM